MKTVKDNILNNYKQYDIVQQIIDFSKRRIDVLDSQIESNQNRLLQAEEEGFYIEDEPRLQELNAKTEYLKGYQQAHIDILAINIKRRDRVKQRIIKDVKKRYEYNGNTKN